VDLALVLELEEEPVAALSKRLRAGLLTQTVTSGAGPALIEPLKDSTGASELKKAISQLSQYSKRARRHPIAR